MDINISIKGLMGMSLEDIREKPVVITKKKKKKKGKKNDILKMIGSSIPKKSEYTTEVI